MSSARLPLALAALGLAACAHTPPNTVYVMPDVRHAAPVIVKNVNDVPEGFDEHVVVSINREGLRHIQEQAVLAARTGRYYGYPASGSARLPSVATARPDAGPGPVIAPPAPAATSSPAARHAPRQFGDETTRSRR